MRDDYKRYGMNTTTLQHKMQSVKIWGLEMSVIFDNKKNG